MAIRLHNIIQDVFRNSGSVRARCADMETAAAPWPSQRFLTVSLEEDSFEVPAFAMSCFMELIEVDPYCACYDKIVARLYTMGYKTSYKSFDKIFKESIRESFQISSLVYLKDPKSPSVYFSTYGAVFDDEYNPIMLCTWEIRREIYHEEVNGILSQGVRYHFVRPIIRISPECFILQVDSVQRCICKKFASTALGTEFIRAPSFLSSLFQSNPYYDVKIIVDSMPFDVRNIAVPSVSTTNESLLKVAKDHLNELPLCQ